MKLVIAAACLVASLSLATHALADGRTVATLQQPVASKTEFTVDGGVWRCDQSACIASYTPDQSFGVSQCRDVARLAKSPVVSFEDEQHNTLQPAKLDKCNDGFAPSRTVAASH
jgi:hypothetical protein